MYRNVPPPSASIANYSSSKSIVKHKATKGYFDDDDDDDDANGNHEAIGHTNQTNSSNNSYDEEIDPLDAFMSQVESQIKKQESTLNSTPLPEIVSEGLEDDDDECVVQFMRHDDSESENEREYDSDGETKKGRVEPLPPVDHTVIKYNPITRINYRDNSEISSWDEVKVSTYLKELEITVSGSNIPRPIANFSQAGFYNELLQDINKRGFEFPTAIQAQAIPVALSGRDIIGLAKTGSGKTYSFVWPVIMHVVTQPQLKSGDGPVGIILAPTRELAHQIFTECIKFAHVYNIRVCAIFGGAGKWEMIQELKKTPEIVIATPGRLIELIRIKATNLTNCSFIVLDEADRMFEMGFEYQMRSIVNNIRPDRQTLLFSATMRKKIEGFAREILKNPIRIIVGTIGQANPDIKQVVNVVSNPPAKWAWLSSNLDEFVANGKVLIFVNGKQETEELTKQLQNYFTRRQLDIDIACLHGDKDQSERAYIVKQFSKKDGTSVLVATDIASRGLDIKDIRTVINYDVPKNIETYVHRIGRTGRMCVDGVVPGISYTLLLAESDGYFAVDLVHNLRQSCQIIPNELQRVAESNPKWSKVNLGKKGGGAMSSGGRVGLGFGGAGGPRAMTSHQLAQATKTLGGSTSSSVVELNSGLASLVNFAGNKYIEGQSMGRGKHLTQPSWTLPDSSYSTDSSSKKCSDPEPEGLSSSAPPTQPDLSQISSNQSLVSSGQLKRKSRFSATSVASVDPLALPFPFPSSGSVLPGFVKAKETYHSVQTSGPAIHSSSQPTSAVSDVKEPAHANISNLNGHRVKKSRWDNIG